MPQSDTVRCGSLHFVLKLGLLLFLLQSVKCLQCRLCHNVHSLDQCHGFATCSADEECYTDEKVTTSGLVFAAGCRAKDVCSTSPSTHPLGRRAATGHVDRRVATDELIACSRCCDTDRDNVTGTECNTKLCGLLGTSTAGQSLCYDCEVYLMADCTSTTLCQANEVCYSKTILHADLPPRYKFGCTNARTCIGQTKVLLQLKEKYSAVGRRASTNGSPKSAMGTLSKRISDVPACDTCCGDPMCNTGDCVKLVDKLYLLYKNGHLDLNTMKVTH